MQWNVDVESELMLQPGLSAKVQTLRKLQHPSRAWAHFKGQHHCDGLKKSIFSKPSRQI